MRPSFRVKFSKLARQTNEGNTNDLARLHSQSDGETVNQSPEFGRDPDLDSSPTARRHLACPAIVGHPFEAV